MRVFSFWGKVLFLHVYKRMILYVGIKVQLME